MEKEIKELWKSKFDAAIDRIGSLNKWLIVLNLTIAFTVGQRYYKLKTERAELLTKKEILSKPWDKLRELYENTNGFMANYVEDQSLQFSQLCVFGDIDLIKTDEGMKKLHQNDSVMLHSIEQVGFSGKALSYYNSELSKISSRQRNLRVFEDLNKDDLLNLMNIFTFDTLVNPQRLQVGIDKALMAAKLLRYISDKNFEEEGKKTITDRLDSIYSRAIRRATFSSFASEMLLRDMRGFGDERITNKELVKLHTYLEKSNFSSLSILKKSYDQLNEDVQKLESGDFFEIPLVSVNITLHQFTFVGGIINLCILIFFFITLNQTTVIWNNYKNSLDPSYSKEYKEVVFFNWTFGIKQRLLFTIAYSFFLSFISWFSLIIASRLFNKPIFSNWIIIFIVLLNLILAVILSHRYFNFKQSEKN